ncbi:replication protein A 70 kDa DNA-binding subunit B [Tanacetum coccineum]
MVNQSFLISNIYAVKDNFSINAKVVRLWRQYYYGGDTLASMDMILMDQEGSRISATISNKMVSLFDSLLKEGGSVSLSNFYVVKNNAPYKVASHPFKINFHKKTKVKAIQSVFSSKYGFSFLPFTEFVEDNVKEDQVVFVRVSNTFYSSRFFINEEIPKIDDFRLRLLARVGDDTSSLQVSNLTSKSSQALEEKSFFYGTKYVNLEQLMDVIETEVKDVNKDGYDTDVDNEEPILETTQTPILQTSTPSKDVKSSMSENVVKVEPVEVTATPLQGKHGIVDVDKDNFDPFVTLRNKKKVVFSRRDK